ncbi:MAG: MotA/TolQ/ExbB proton channel family protein [Deltaproteobacteria bacterium]|nr:MotA/TolQ/ExbB proton channel family protein [Deltaproteobacteria bacterium]
MEFTLPQMWAQMGFIAKAVVVILGIESIFVIAVSLERLIVYVRARGQSRRYAMHIRRMLERGEYQQAADAAAQFQGSHIAKVIRSGLQEYVKGTEGDGKAAYDVLGAVNRALEKTGERQMAQLRRGLAGLATVGSTAPFVGLFGTVFGIINSFQGMAKEGGGGLGAVSAGIAEALVTTAVGIGVAVVAVLLYNYFTAKAESLQVDTNESAVEIMDVLIKQSSSPAAGA